MPRKNVLLVACRLSLTMPSAGLFLFLGADRARKLQRVQELERALGVQPFDRHQVDGAATEAKALLALCRQRPAASPLRLVVVDEAQRLNAGCVGALLDAAELIAANAAVVCLAEVELTARQPLNRLVGQVTVERFPGRNVPAVKPFALTEALCSRDVASALKAVQDQLGMGKEPLELLGLIAWQLNRWVTVKRLGAEGYSAERMVSATGLHPWQVQRLQAEVGRRSLASLERLLERCWQLDVDAKRGRAIPELAVEQLVFEVCASTAN